MAFSRHGAGTVMARPCDIMVAGRCHWDGDGTGIDIGIGARASGMGMVKIMCAGGGGAGVGVSCAGHVGSGHACGAGVRVV
ncbi:hypothetical protein [Novacetimonas hansenii]|uniref:hypothetical protein n=1 Tax=Novacetimonas hansenii TaxID=436 RepID=UPI00117BC562|nr:hypothetical protein [Novacetimonas hansenii]